MIKTKLLWLSVLLKHSDFFTLHIYGYQNIIHGAICYLYNF